MSNNSLAVFLSRLDFAWITSFHILYPPLTIGLAVILFFFEWRWMVTDDERWYRLSRFFEKLFVINFGAGCRTTSNAENLAVVESRFYWMSLQFVPTPDVRLGLNQLH